MSWKNILSEVVIFIVLMQIHTSAAFMIPQLVEPALNDPNQPMKEIPFLFYSFSQLKPGDIAFKHPEAFRGPVIIDHCLLCTEYNYSTDTYTFIEAHFHHGVQYRYEKRENLTHLGWGPYARVKGVSDTQINNAISFATQQIGRGFQINWVNKNHNPTNNTTDPYATEWYCSELIWAAYYNCNHNFSVSFNESSCIYGDGIDIDFNGWTPVMNHVVVAPRDIIFDDNVRRLWFPFFKF